MKNKKSARLFPSVKIRYTILIPMIIWLLISSTILSLLIINISANVMEEENISFINKTHEEVGSQIKLAFNQLSLFGYNLLTTNNLHKILKSETLTSDEKSEQLIQLLDDLHYDTSMIGFIKFVSTDQNIYDYAFDPITIPDPDSNQMDKYLTDNYVWQWGDMVRDEEGQPYLPYVLKLYRLSAQTYSGFAMIYVKQDVLYNSYKNMAPYGSDSFIISDDYTIVSHSRPEYVGYKIMNGDTYTIQSKFGSKRISETNSYNIITITNLEDYVEQFHLNWYLVTEIPANILFKDLQQVRYNIIIITFITMFIISFVVFTLSKTLSQSIIGFNNRIQNYIKHNIQEKRSKDRVKNEITELELAYDALIQRINVLIESNNIEKEKQRELELQALQAQINPHFLYNTLDAVAWMAKMKQQNDIVDIIIALATFFRLSLHKGDKCITVEEEVDIVRSYVFIEQIRFPNKIQLEIDIDEDILDYTILKLTLQPFIENAIKHGISKKKGLGTIKLVGKQIDDMIHFTIIDDGIGNDDLDAFNKPTKVKSGGYGICNVRERILLEYGNKTSLTIESSKEAGTKIHIKIPLQYL